MAGLVSDAAAMTGVAMLLVSAFSRDTVTSKDLTAADEAVRGLTFDLFNEHVSSDVMAGIELADFETLINGIAKRMNIPDDIRLDILRSKLAATRQEVVRNFHFAKGETGSFTFGRIDTVKPNKSTINLAYSLYHLDFKLSPQVIEHTKKKKFFGFTIGKKVWRETKERNLSTREQEHLSLYFMDKAIKGFKGDFHFAKSENGSFTYGRIATVEPDEFTINLAYSMYHPDWHRPHKHTPQAPQEIMTFIWYTIGREVWLQLGKDVPPLKNNTKRPRSQHLVDEL